MYICLNTLLFDSEGYSEGLRDRSTLLTFCRHKLLKSNDNFITYYNSILHMFRFPEFFFNI